MSSKSKVRVATIGAGNLANMVHYPSLKEIDDVELVGICDVVETKLKETAEKYEIPATFTDYRKMLDETQPDAVYILMPPHHLFDLAADCLKRKHHIFIEKPPGLTAYQTASLANLAEKNACLTMAGFQRRFSPILVEAKRRAEEHGPILQCLARFVKSGGVNRYYDGAIDILTCDAIHAVDLLRWMGGEVSKISSTVSNFNAETENAFNALVEFESGSVGMLLTNWVTGRRIYSAEMHSFNFSAFAEPDDKAVFYQDGDTKGEELLSSEVAGSSEQHRFVGFYDESRHFIESIQNGTLPQTHFGDAVKTMELVERIYRSKM
jgi:predicted dehydrogenase